MISGKPETGSEGQGRILTGFSEHERCQIQDSLNLKLGPEYISFRVGAGNTKIPYIEGWRAINLANEVFGFDGWSSYITNIHVDYLDDAGDFRFNCGVSASVRVQLKDGSYHEDIGYGVSENQRGKGAALEKAKKEAITDATKRALRVFGNSLGNCVYDRDYLKHVKRLPETSATQVPRPEMIRRPHGDQYGRGLVRGSDMKFDTTTDQTRMNNHASHPEALKTQITSPSSSGSLHQNPSRPPIQNPSNTPSLPIQHSHTGGQSLAPKTPIRSEHESSRPIPITSTLIDPSAESILSVTNIRVIHKEDSDEFPDYPADDVDIYHAMDTIEYELNAHNYSNNEVRVSPTNDAKKLRL